MPKKRSNHCFVPECNTQYDKNIGLSLFGVPKNDELLKQWERLIPRSDKKLDKFSAVCEKHFIEDHIIRNFVHNVNGEIIKIPRRPVLTHDAIPTIYPNLPKYLTKTLPKKRKLREYTSNCSTDYEVVSSNVSDFTFSDLNYVNLPSTVWAKQIPLNEKNSIIFHTVSICPNRKLSVEKLIIFTEKNLNIDCEIFFKGLKIEMPKNIDSKENVETLLKEVDNLQVCKGAGYVHDFDKTNCFQRQKCVVFENTVFSNNCVRQCKELSVCLHCKYLRRLMLHNIARSKQVTLQTKVKKYASISRKNKRLKKRLESVQDQINIMQQKNRELSCIDAQLQDLPLKQQEMIKHCLQSAKKKSLHGMRYSNEWVLECLLMHIKNPKLYEHIRRHKIMVMPSRRTIRKYLSNYNSGFGFNPTTFELISEKAKSMENFQKHGGLLIDEIKLTEKLQAKHDGQVEGFVDLGYYTPESMKNQPCNHGLLILFSPFTGDWKQVIGVFSTSNNVSANLLSKLIIEATVLVENAGLFVDFVTCDGASWNRSMWNLFGIRGKSYNAKTGTSVDTVCKISHPLDISRYLHFVSDFPHLIKCLRNTFIKKGFLLPEGEARLEHIEAAWREDCNNVTLKAMPKITHAHLHPNNFEKMRVNYAFNLFSEEVLKGLFLYKKQCEFQYGSCKATTNFVKCVKELIDVMTGNTPQTSLRPKSKQEEILKTFLTFLDDWESHVGSEKVGFLSKSTADGLRVTLHSTLSLLQYLSESIDLKYLMTSRLSQDAIENIFGIVRQSSGCNDHPTPTEFLVTINCLSFYNLAKPPETGNSYAQTINSYVGSKKSENLSDTSKLDELLDAGLLDDASNLIASKFAFHSAESILSSQDPQNQLLVYLAGYVARKFVLKNKCEACKSSCLIGNPDGKEICKGTMISEFDRGGLIYPSNDLLSLVYQLEHIIVNYFENNELHRDSIIDILAVLFEKKIRFVGCTNHKNSLSCRITKFFLLTRLHFYIKGINKTKQECRDKAKYLKLRRLK